MSRPRGWGRRRPKPMASDDEWHPLSFPSLERLCRNVILRLWPKNLDFAGMLNFEILRFAQNDSHRIFGYCDTAPGGGGSCFPKKREEPCGSAGSFTYKEVKDGPTSDGMEREGG